MKIGPYEVAEEIGRGGMGVVHRGRAPDGTTVAIKLLPRADRGDAAVRFDRERRLLGSLGLEEGFVPLLDAGEQGGAPYLVMPFVGGGTLRDRLRRGPLGVEQTQALGIALALALGRAHAKGIVHRDLKPENILFADVAPGETTRPLIADLGLAKHFRADAPGASQSTALTRPGDWKGTIGYMAPEQLRAARDAGPAADVFALGATLYECLAGDPPFAAPNVLVALEVLERGAFAPLRSTRPEIPLALALAIERALARDPAARYPDGAAFAEALRAGIGAGASRWLGLAGAAALVVVALAAAVAHRRHASASVPAASPKASLPTPTPGPAARATPATAPSPGAAARPVPDWFRDLPAAEKPALPLPTGLEPSLTPREYRYAPTGARFVYVGAGSFLMGSDEFPDTAPVHSVTLPGFFFGKLEVSVAEFRAFVGETGYVTEPEQRGAGSCVARDRSVWVTRKGVSWKKPEPGLDAKPTDPVCLVSWNDAKAYVAWAGCSLPTEAEWERAALWDPVARRSHRFAWGDAIPSASSPRYANLPDESALRRFTDAIIYDGYDDGYVLWSPVGTFPDGAAPCGALDTIGNVNEWCEDAYEPAFYQVSPLVDPICPPGNRERRVWRGGNFVRVYQGYGWFRGFRKGDSASDSVGIRCVLDHRSPSWR